MGLDLICLSLFNLKACMSLARAAAVFRSHHRALAIAHSVYKCGMSTESSASAKQAARKAAKEALRCLTADQMAAESAAITGHLSATGLLDQPRRVAMYVHCPQLREVDTTHMLEATLARGTRVYAPRVLDHDANMHFLHITSLEELESVPPFGIREPLLTYADGSPREDACEMDHPVEVVVMPGLAFTAAGHRLGRGGGYYDKFIATCQRRALEKGWIPPLLVALAFKAQVVESVPCDEHDQAVDLLITPEGASGCSERGRDLAARWTGETR